MEGETIKKKYMTILDMLKKERLTFGNQIEGLEAQLKKQEEEIDKLKVREFKNQRYKITISLKLKILLYLKRDNINTVENQ